MQGELIIKAIEDVTNAWYKQRKREVRGRPEVVASRRRTLNNEHQFSPRVTIIEIVEKYMHKAYMKASSGDTLPAHARQIYYAIRPFILAEAIDRHGNAPKFKSVYFTQTLLPQYMKEYSAQTKGWDVVFDSRGHLIEPHTEKTVPLGTLDVRHYLQSTKESGSQKKFYEIDDAFPTMGPVNRFGAILFVEKEGFFPLFKAALLAERYDIAIMSTKGMSVTAARSLVENICGTYGIPLLLLRDFDKAGFAIAASFMKDTRRYQFKKSFEVIDLGLRLNDIKAWNLESEDVHYTSNPMANLRVNGASQEEVVFLCENGSNKNYYGRRVELNAFASDDFLRWIESKLDHHRIKKIIPEKKDLADAYARAIRVATVNNAIETALDEAEDAVHDRPMPETLRQMIDERLKNNPTQPWDKVVAELAADAISIEGGK